jgi:hypothetical protein
MITNYTQQKLSTELIDKAIAAGCITISDLAKYLKGLK